MIYRYHIFEDEKQFKVDTNYSIHAMNSLLRGFPEQLRWVLDGAEIHNEIIDLEKQEVYLKITTEIAEATVANVISNKLRLTGLSGTRLI